MFQDESSALENPRFSSCGYDDHTSQCRQVFLAGPFRNAERVRLCPLCIRKAEVDLWLLSKIRGGGGFCILSAPLQVELAVPPMRPRFLKGPSPLQFHSPRCPEPSVSARRPQRPSPDSRRHPARAVSLSPLHSPCFPRRLSNAKAAPLPPSEPSH